MTRFLLAAATAQAQAREPASSGGPESILDRALATDVAYVADPHDRQRLDIAYFKDSPPTRALVVWIHGGAYMHGDKHLELGQ